MKQPEQNCRGRAFELDVFRGLAILMMVLHHLIFDLRYIFGLDIFKFQESWWFDALLRPVFLFVFLLVSGICCTFSRSNLKRGLRMLAAAAAFTTVTVIVWLTTGQELAIFFNILHLLALGTLLYYLLEKILGQDSPAFFFWLIMLAALSLWAGSILPLIPAVNTYAFLPLGIMPPESVGMGDYLPLLPWLGFFLTGAVIGRVVYKQACTKFPGAPERLVKTAAPLIFLGRNALWVYALHQPVLLALLFGMRQFGII